METEEESILHMKRDFLRIKKWKGKVPRIFDEYVTYIFDMKDEEEVNPAHLLNTLIRVNFNYHDFIFGYGDI